MGQPSVSLDPQSPAFDSPDDAAHALAPKLSSDGKEFAAVLYKNADGKYQYSTLAQGDHDNFALAAKMPKGGSLAGIVHSHPGQDQWGQMFSPNDVQTANQLKVPSYVHFLKTGSVRKYTPGTTATRKIQKPGQRDWLQVADGDEVQQSAPVQAPAPAAPQGQGLLSQASQVNVEGSEMTDSTIPSATPPITSFSGNTTQNTQTGSNSAPTLSQLQSQMPSNVPQSSTVLAGGTGQAKTTNADLTSNAQADTATSQNYQAGTLGGQDSTNTDAQLNSITSENSPYMQLARQQGMLTAAQRGLQNSSLAAGSSEAAAVAAAAPLAEQNASEASTAAAQNANLGTQVSEQNAQLGTQANEFNTSENVAQNQLNAQLGTQTSQYNAGQRQQEAEFNAQQAQQSSQANTQISASMESQILQQNADLNKQYLSGTQAEDLASIQGQYNELISTNQAASNLYQSYLTSIGTAMANKDIDPARIAQDIQAQQSMLASGLALINSMNAGGVVNLGGAGTVGAGTVGGGSVGTGTVGGTGTSAGGTQITGNNTPGMVSQYTIGPNGMPIITGDNGALNVGGSGFSNTSAPPNVNTTTYGSNGSSGLGTYGNTGGDHGSQNSKTGHL